ncbi:MAG TPA: trypsin-like peptidase domain-containing protein [Actinomycetes bacterium]|nr:trypsin-like peptidase domain-containing protein [Actinomycetes bacterium]
MTHQDWSQTSYAGVGSAPPDTPDLHDTAPQPPHDRGTFSPWQPAARPGSPAPPAGPGAAPAGERPRRPIALVAAVALVAGLLGGGAGAAVTLAVDDQPAATQSGTSGSSLQTSAPRADTPPTEGSVEQVAAQVLPSVVSIQVSTGSGGGEGTGVIIDPDGLILTNNHVVEAAANGGGIEVTFNDGATASASIVGLDPVTDLAVIKAEGVGGLPAATLGSSADLDPGEVVVAIGSPLGLQGTVTSGIVSALDRPVRTGNANGAESLSTVIDAIQTDAAINPGNSGGPLVNLRGEVVGINSAIATLGSGGQSGSIGLGFSIPIDQAKSIARQLIDTGTATHALLGVSVQDTQRGAGIAQVAPDGAADGALRAGDVITKVGDRRIDSADALIAAIRSQRPGDEVTLTYVRGGQEQTVTVTLGSDG